MKAKYPEPANSRRTAATGWFRGFDYYWFALEHIVHTPTHSTDLEAIEDGYVTVTPLHLDMTYGPALEVLAEKYR
jgi:5'-nucleotidase